MKRIFLFLMFLSVMVLAGNTVLSPNMSLPVPVVGTDPGPDWANNINSSLSIIDSHDHTPGKGVQISSGSININSDFSLNGNSLTNAKGVVFTSQSVTPSAIGTIFEETPDLFYYDGNGNTIRITQNGSVAGASGTITGLPSGTASASYQSVGGTFQFQSATNTPANISGASYVMAQQTSSPNTITLKSPNSLASSYNVTFPAALPAANSIVQMSTSGGLTLGPTAPVTPAGVTINSSGTLSTFIPTFFAGTQPIARNWSTGSATFADLNIDSSTNTLTTLTAQNITVTAAASNLLGITWTPTSSTAAYLVSCTFTTYNQTQAQQYQIQLTDGTTVVAVESVRMENNATVRTQYAVTLSGIYAPGTGSAVTLKVQGKTSSGTVVAAGDGNASPYWSVYQIQK